MLELDRIYNMDCLDGMKQIDDESVDLVITDPMYVPKSKLYWETFDNWYWDWNEKWITEVKRILKKEFHFFISFSSDDMARFELLLQKLGFNIASRIVWNYRNAGGRCQQKYCFGKTYDFIFHCSSGKKLNFPEKWDDRRFDVKTYAIPQSNFKDKKYNHYQKPLELWKELIEFASNDNDFVLDPFIGSGTTAVACKELSRKFIGFEVNPEYCSIAEKRISEVKTIQKHVIEG